MHIKLSELKEEPPKPAKTVEKTHLSESYSKWSESSRNYLKVLGIVAVVVAIGVTAIGYFTLPGFGDPVRGPKGLEDAMRDHFLVNEKRTATDITFYDCDTYYWARVGVERRPDIKTNPIYLVDKYIAKALAVEGDRWAIVATAVTSPEMDTPCG